ncbi:MAG: 2-amino-4-hydroxy-6-hydroxymethyldihydropteridine diphosphokinase [Bacteroidales bacterium]|jgi:2-amino-4-hydroxy-6-hydroxymethyldihydropteridine diphosphokinase
MKGNNILNTCIIGIGSNIDAVANIKEMLEILGSRVKIIKTSSFIKTKPIGITQQPDFTNGAVKIETPLSQEELKNMLISIEDQLGRNRQLPKFGPRTMDLDIVTWNGEIVDDDYYTRSFLRATVDEINRK